MNIAKVVGTIVCTKTSIEIQGAKYLLLERANQKGELKSEYIVALDLVGAGKD